MTVPRLHIPPAFSKPAESTCGRSVLVLLAAYNGSQWIEQQIRSILEQTGVAVTIVARDDGSTDSTADILSKLAEGEPRIRAQRACKPSGSASQNFFSIILDSDASAYDFVALADQDDIWDRSKLKSAVEALDRADTPGYSSAVTAFWPSGRTHLLRQKNITTDGDFLFEGAGHGCTFVLTRWFYTDLRSFFAENTSLINKLHFHDWTIYALARSWGYGWTFDPVSTMQYRQHHQNDTGARASLNGVRSRVERVRYGWYRQQLTWMQTLCGIAAPSNVTIIKWGRIFHSKSALFRRFKVAFFCLLHSRRRSTDKLALAVFSILGWI